VGPQVSPFDKSQADLRSQAILRIGLSWVPPGILAQGPLDSQRVARHVRCKNVGKIDIACDPRHEGGELHGGTTREATRPMARTLLSQGRNSRRLTVRVRRTGRWRICARPAGGGLFAARKRGMPIHRAPQVPDNASLTWRPR